jgi:hypothetical protein
MAEEKQRGNLRATLALTQEEARTGIERLVTLPGGRKVSLFVYPGAYNEQKIHLSGRGEPTADGTPGDLIVTLLIPPADSLVMRQFDSNSSPIIRENTTYSNQSPYLTANPPSSVKLSSSVRPSAYPTARQSPKKSSHTSSVPFIRSFKLKQPYYISDSLLAIFSQPLTSRQRSPLIFVFILLLVFMLLIGGSLVLYTTIYVPHKASSDATAIAVAQATQVAQANATAFARQAATAAAIEHATAIALAQLQDDYITTTASIPSLSDPLQTPYVTDWDINSNCRFSGGAYHVTSSAQKTIALCLAANTSFSNFAFQIHMNRVSSNPRELSI